MDPGFKNLKLVLLGLVIVSVPILFIFQNEVVEKKTDDLETYKAENAKLSTYNEYLKELIKFYGIQINALRPEGGKSNTPPISFNPVINIPETSHQGTSDYKTELNEIALAIKSLTPANYSEGFKEIAAAINGTSVSKSYPPIDEKLISALKDYNKQYLDQLLSILNYTASAQNMKTIIDLNDSIFQQRSNFKLVDEKRKAGKLFLEDLIKQIESSIQLLKELESINKDRPYYQPILEQRIRLEELLKRVNDLEKYLVA